MCLNPEHNHFSDLDCFSVVSKGNCARQGSLIEAIAFLRYYSQLCLDYSNLHGNENPVSKGKLIQSSFDLSTDEAGAGRQVV